MKKLIRKDNGRLFVLNEPRFLSALKDFTFNDIWQLQFEQTVKFVRRGRKTGWLYIKGLGRVYLKRGSFNLLINLLNRLRKFTKQISSFRDEAEALLRLQQSGIRTTPFIAFGIRRSGVRRLSFLITEDVGEHPRLRDYFPQHYGRSSCGALFEKRRRFISHLAETVSKMHRCGINHRDLYATHILVTGDSGEEDFIILDLNRADVRKSLPERWVVKDLAALAATTPNASRADRIRFLKSYLGCKRLNNETKRLARKIWKREKKLKKRIRHSEMKDRTFVEKHNGALPSSL